MNTGLTTSRARILLQFATCWFAVALCTAQPPAAGDMTPPEKKIATAHVVDFKKLLPFLPEPPEGWKAEPAEGSTEDMGEAEISNVHRDYQKGDGDNVPTTSISILDSAANPEYVEMTIAGWNENTTDAEGYTKSLSIEGLPGFETYENDGKHGSLWIIVAKRYILQIEITGQESAALQEWLKRIDLKKLAEVK
jgi:hypothetical protein